MPCPRVRSDGRSRAEIGAPPPSRWQCIGEREAGRSVRSSGHRQDTDRAAEGGDRPGGHELLERGRRAAECRTGRAGPLSSRPGRCPTRRTSRPVSSRRHGERGKREATADARAGPSGGAPRPWDAKPTIAAAPATRTSAGQPRRDPPVRVRSVARRDPEQVRRQDTRPGPGPPGRWPARWGRPGRRRQQDDGERPRMATLASRTETAATAPAMTAIATPARVGLRRSGSRAVADRGPGRSGSRGSRTCRGASSAATPAR